jgi:hypothetical protein
MKHTRSLEGLCKAAVTVTLLLTFSAASWGQTRLHNAPVGAEVADETARTRGRLDQPAACRDTTPHKVTFVEVEPGVKLEVLDWGGSGEVMVLLTGSGDNAHVFDYFAFQFTDFFHVIGITRRGWLPSSQPKNGYDDLNIAKLSYGATCALSYPENSSSNALASWRSAVSKPSVNQP